MSSPATRGGAVASCDICRARKLKCTRNDNGDCQRCSRSGIECVTNRKRASRPYYQTTKEQFKLMAAIVHHFLPGASLDKNDLQNTLRQLQSQATPPTTDGGEDPPPSSIPRATSRTVEEADKRYDPPWPSRGSVQQYQSHNDSILTEKHPGASIAVTSQGVSPCPSSMHTPASSADQGSLILRDAAQVPRYYNGTCYKTFFSIIYSSIRSSAHSQLFDAQPPIDAYPLDGQCNPLVAPADLPLRSLISEAAQKFFAEINNTTYILNYHHFQKLVQDIYDTDAKAFNATLAIVHLVAFLGTSDPVFFANGVKYGNASVEEGSLESVQAIMLMAFGYMLKGQLNIAWISLGGAVRIAQSLGLHSNDLVCGNEPIHTSESRKKLWWSLFDLDITLSSIMGRPPSVDKDLVYASVPQDMDFEPNAFTPPGYPKASAELAVLHSEVIRELYLRPANPRDSEGLTDKLLRRLQTWWHDLPLYLKPGCPAAPAYMRAITLLGLRYYYALNLITQPYLLHSTLNPPVSVGHVEKVVAVCEESNIEAMVLVKNLVNSDLTSKMNFFDAFHILTHGIILALRSIRCQSSEVIGELDKYVPLLSFADHFVIGKFGKESLKVLLLKLTSKRNSGTDKPWPEDADLQTGQVLLDMFEVTDLQWLDNFGIDPATL